MPRWSLLLAAVLLATGLACLGGPPAPDPDPIPSEVVEATPPPTPAAPPPSAPPPAEIPEPLTEAVGHCQPGEVAWFSCPVEGGKQVSLCGAPDLGSLQYRFGRIGSIELALPEDATTGPERVTVGWFPRPRTIGSQASFQNAGVRYDIASYAEGDIDSGDLSLWQGVYVWQDDRTIATLACTSTSDAYLGDLQMLLEDGT